MGFGSKIEELFGKATRMIGLRPLEGTNRAEASRLWYCRDLHCMCFGSEIRLSFGQDIRMMIGR